MLKVELPIYWHTDASRMKEDLGIDSNDENEFEEYETRMVTFYEISGITRYDNKDEVTKIFSNGDTFLCALPFSEVEKLIDNANA